MFLKKSGIITTYDNYLENIENNTNKIVPVVTYKGDDENDKPLYP